MKSAILLESNDILIMTKVETEMEAKALPFQALVGLKDTMSLDCGALGNCRGSSGEKLPSGYQINSLEDAPHHKSALRELLGQKDLL